MAKRVCPVCGSKNTITILYGMPTEQSFLLAEEGKIMLGGCCVAGSDPEHHCKDCSHEWREKHKTKERNCCCSQNALLPILCISIHKAWIPHL
ncbi:MAG: hypothetical protein RBR15_05500 [Sphaerochaeta sp.]|nr:hypothetical protein [Sphaerochaeta sp.]